MAYPTTHPLECLPTLGQYTAGINQFLGDSEDWADIDPYQYYTVNCEGEWRESSDNARGGIDVAWTFRARRLGQTITTDNILQNYARLISGIIEIVQDDMEG